jgi:hypothetical protein
VTVVSSAVGQTDFPVGASTIGAATELTSSQWHHYAFSFYTNSSGVELNFFYDGDLREQHQIITSSFGRVTGSLSSSIGALVAEIRPGTHHGATRGYGQLSGAIDEFRFWKYKRPTDLIRLNYFKTIDGGTNTDDDSYNLGFYYKFNEGISGDTGTDETVLDYSGRISNGTWVGYGTNSRDLGSAITDSGAETEKKDVIVRSNHPDVITNMESYRLSGSFYDIENPSYFYNLFPDWITEEDGEEGRLLKELVHIGASYFDTLHQQIKFLKDIKYMNYLSASAKPITFADLLVENLGLTVPNLFLNSKVYEKILNQDENELYDKTLFDVKNQIYHNIYNNIHSILKSKGDCWFV